MGNTAKSERKPQIGFPGTDELQEALRDIKDRTGIKIADLGREALWQKIKEIRETHPAYNPGNVVAAIEA